MKVSFPKMPTAGPNTELSHKAEGGQVNIGLGRGAGLDTFNAKILDFSAVPK
jgi:hypothetical protein